MRAARVCLLAAAVLLVAVPASAKRTGWRGVMGWPSDPQKATILFDGHLTQERTDLKLQGRHLSFEVRRTYTSAGTSDAGTLGAGWSWSYEASVTPSSCGLVFVSDTKGGVVFRTLDGGHTFTPQKGHHGQLKRLDDLSYEYTDKEGVRYLYREPVDPMQPDGAQRLDRIVEPHGDRIEISYDLLGRVATIREVLKGERVVRTLSVRYVRILGEDRVSSIASNLGHLVEYSYDQKGNLTGAKRSGANLEGAPDAIPSFETYEYSTGSLRDPHQMTAVNGPNGERTEYSYYATTDPVTGEPSMPNWVVPTKEELVKGVKEVASATEAPTTQFGYDFTEAPSGVYKTTVTDARTNPTLYTMNSGGQATKVEEPLGKLTLSEWATADVLKTKETDALGRVTDLGYDARGNRTSERITTADLGVVETAYEYHPRFNKPTLERDAEGRETHHTIDETTGDVLGTRDPVGNVTENHYDADGRLEWTKDPRGHVTHFRDFNDFGRPREVENALGQVTYLVYDARGRLVEERQEPYGRVKRTVYDGFDRPVEEVRLSGRGEGDERTTSEYYAGGQVLAQTNSLGARTEYALDKLDRVVGTTTFVDGKVLTTATVYDGKGNPTLETDRRGVQKRKTYDALDRLRFVEVVQSPNGEGPLGQVAAYTYDLAGNRRSETDVNGLVTELRQDGLYRLAKKILPVVKPSGGVNYEESYTNDRVGNRTRLVDANGKVSETEYDGLNRVTKVTRDVGGLSLVTTTGYSDPEGSHLNKSEERDVAKGLRTTFVYDVLNRGTSRAVHLEGVGGGGAVLTTTTAYEDQGHEERITDPRGVVTLRKLDGLDRVVEETVDVAGLAGASALNLKTVTTYNGLGLKTSVLDPENHETRYGYDALGRLLKVTDAKEQESVYSYFGDGLKESETDRRGVKRLFSYDSLGRPRTSLLAQAPFSSVLWSHGTEYVNGLQPKRIETDARGQATTFDLDGLGRVVKETDKQGKYRTTTWDGVNKREETDKEHQRTAFEWDGVDRLVKTTDPLQKTKTVVYEDAQNRKTETDERGVVKRTEMDPLGRVLSVTRAASAADEAVVETNTYDGNGNRETQMDAAGKKTRFSYDAANRVASRTSDDGAPTAETTTYKYDRAGNPVEEKRARAAANGDPWSLKKTYDELNRLSTSTDGEAHTTVFGYDEEGDKTSEQTPKGELVTTAYDELKKPVTVTLPETPQGVHPVIRFSYNENRDLVRMEDADGRVTRLEYDELGRLFRTTRDPGGLELTTTTTEFDADGRPKRILEANGETTLQTWDELGRLKTRTHQAPASGWTAPWAYTSEESYSYDPNGNLERVEERDVRRDGLTTPVRVTTRSYDLLDRKKSETTTLQDGSAWTVSTDYFKNGRVKSQTDPRGTTSYTYDGHDREETVTTAGGVTTKTYYPDGLVKDVVFPNGTKRSYGYDKADRLLSIVTTKGAATVASTVYTLDENGNRLTQVQSNGGAAETTVYSYDKLDRLASVSYPADGAHPNGRKVSYGHDKAGNRTSEVTTDPVTLAVLESKAGVFDSANRLTTLTDDLDASRTRALVWDRNGNLLSDTKAGVTTSYRYDLRDTLAEVERGGQTLARFLGDFDERRVLKVGDPTRPAASGVQEYLYQDKRLVGEVENGQQVSRYEWTNEELESLQQTDGTRRYYALDGLETVLALTDEQGQATDRLNFDVWGVPKEGTDFGTSGNRYAFTSHRFDTELQMLYAGGREYDPEIGRFISQDDLSLDPNNPDTWNLFAYARANPTRYVDETGHETGAVTYASVHSDDLHREQEAQAAQAAAAAKACPSGCLSENKPSAISLARGGVIYGAETAMEFASPAPLGLSNPNTSIHPLANTTESHSWLTGDNSLSADYAAFVDRYGRGARVVEGAAVMKFVPGKLSKAVGAAIIVGAMLSGKPEVNGTQGEQGNFGPDRGERDPLPGDKASVQQQAQAAAPGNVATSAGGQAGRAVPGEAGRFVDLDAKAVVGDQLTPHHMPQAAQGFTSRAEGGALMLPHEEHVQTRTYGAAGRRTVKLEAGLSFREVLAHDIRDVRRIAGTKYNEGLLKLTEYYRLYFPELMKKAPK